MLAKYGISILNQNQAEESISELYRSILGREPDKTGLLYFSKSIKEGKMTLESVRQAILSSPEYESIDPKYDFSTDGTVAKGFFDGYEIFKNSSKTGTDQNRLNWRYKAIIESNKDIISDSSILDMASHDGRWAFAALKNNARNILGIEVREHLVKNSVQNLANLGIAKEKYEFRLGDVVKELTSLQKDSFDVVLCLGFFYHTMEHWRILSEIKRINPKYVILDTQVSTLDKEVIEIYLEDSENEANAFFQNHNSNLSLVGKPSRGAIELMLSHLGFEVKIIDWHKLGVKNWKHIVDYYKKERLTFVAINKDR